MRIRVACADRTVRARIVSALEARRSGLEVDSSPLTLLRPGYQDQRLDALVAIITSRDTENSWVYIAVGYAAGRDIPLLVLTEDRAVLESVPFAILIPGGLDSPPALRFHLDTFAASLQTERRTAPDLPPAGEIAAHKLAGELTDIRGLPAGAPSSQLFEQFVEHVLRSANADVVRVPIGSDAGFDLVASIPGFSERSSGAVLIECKRSSQTRVIREAARKLHEQVLWQGAQFGVVVYDESILSTVPDVEVPTVLILGIDELIQGVADRGVTDTFRRARNRAVHQG